MDATQFAYWLQGFVELNGGQPTPEQWQSIKEHLALVFTKVTPPVRVPADWVVPSSPTVTPPQWVGLTTITC